jgi:hypothetical protein
MIIPRQSAATIASIGLLIAMGVATTTSAAAATAPTATSLSAAKINTGKAPCKKLPNLTGKKPGQLLKYKELKVDSSLLTGARMFRILYTTSGVDELDVQASCGLVILPAKPKNRANEIVAYAHGTIGMHQSCQPSNDPRKFIGPGLGAISYGQGKNAVLGTSKNGIMQGLINAGRMVTASDYYSGLGEPKSAQQSYVLGLPAGAAVLDSARAGIQLENGLQKGKNPKSWKVATWGISQGGHAAFWAGQLAKDYYSVTKLKKDPKIKPVGVAAIVPASSFVATDQTPPELVGRHLGDLEMHEPAQVVNGRPVGVMGPLLFSLVMTSWDKYPDTGSLQPGAAFPGYPSSVPRPQMEDVLTSAGDGDGVPVAQNISAGCLTANAALQTQIYNQPQTYGFFVQPIWGGPNGPDGAWQGQLDKTCLDPTTPESLKSWCTWLAYNQPGPDGQNPFNKIPQQADGSYANVLIAEGMADNVVWCQKSGKDLPGPQDCLARQLYDSLAPACSSTSVRLDLFAETKKSPATHGSTNGQIADNGKARFKGSRLAKFFNGTFKDSLKPGCSATVVNGS